MSELVRSARLRRGLSIYDLADRLGVTAGAVSQLEQSERVGTIKLASLERALGALGERLVIATTPITMADRNLMSARSAASAINDELRAADHAAALRLTTQALEHFRQAASESEIDDFLKKPAPIIDRGWDTLFATAVGWEARRRGLRAPRWTRKPALHDEWVPGADVALSDRYVDFLKEAAEPTFRERNIIVREKDLATA